MKSFESAPSLISLPSIFLALLASFFMRIQGESHGHVIQWRFCNSKRSHVLVPQCCCRKFENAESLILHSLRA